MSTNRGLRPFAALLLLLWGMAASLHAVSPVPYTELVSMSLRVQGDGTVSTSMYDDQGSHCSLIGFTSGGDAETGITTAVLRPGKPYTLAMGSGGAGISGWLSFIAPTGYTLFVNESQTNMIPTGLQTSFYQYYRIELRPTAQNNEPMPFGSFSGIQLGKSVTWEVGLGTLYGDRNAGRIVFKDYDLSSSPASRDRVYHALVNNVSEGWNYKNGPSNQTLWQVHTANGIADLTDDPGGDGYTISFYHGSQAEGRADGSAFFHSAPWKTIRVQSPAANQLKVTETEGSAVRVSLLTLTSGSVPSGNYVWTLQEGNGSTWLRTTTQSSSTTGITASGGSVTTAGGYTIHKFASSDTFTVSAASAGSVMDVMVVGGGGGGGSSGYGYGAGGGAGGVVTGSMAVAVQSYGVTVGAGGAVNTNGNNSVFSSFTAIGGGKGGGGAPAVGGAGGSGGGAQDTARGGVAGTGVSGQGNAGGVGSSDLASYTNCGGGGGAGAAGGNASGGTSAGAGGDGVASGFSGSSVTYGGGGGGYAQSGSQGSGGAGGGGAGAPGTGGAGSPNTGGGGGGSGGTGGAGGSGVVIIRYLTPASIRDVIEVIHTDDISGPIVAKTKYRYENVGGWGEELTQLVADPDAAALTTTFTYHTSSSNLGNFRRVRSVTQPTGNWSAQEFYDDWNRRGQMKFSYAPELDTPATVPTTLVPTSGRVVSYDYVADPFGRYSRPSLREERVNNVLTAKTTWTHGDIIVANEWPREHFTTYRHLDNSGNNYVSDYTERFRADAWPSIAGHVITSKGADLTQESWSRVSGDYNVSTGGFTTGTSIAYIREIFIHGTTSSANGAQSVSSWDGHTFPATYLIPNQSTMDVVIYSNSVRLRTEKRVYTGSGNFTLLNWGNTTWNNQVRPTEQLASNGATVTNTYTDGFLTKVVGADGTETQYTPDLLWRTSTATKKGTTSAMTAEITAGYSYPAQADITTTYTYDGANHVTQTVTAAGPLPLTLTNKAAYDKAGRPIQQIQNFGSSHVLTTDIDYTDGGRKVTTTFPGSPSRPTKVTEAFPDGQLKSVTGTGVVHEFYYPDIGSGGVRTLRTRSGTDTTTALATNTTFDWLGRKISQTQTTWSGGTSSNTWSYNSKGQLWKATAPGVAPSLFEYDTLGRQYRQAADLNENDVVDLGSDRVAETAAEIKPYDSGTTWWVESRSYAYAQANSTATLTGTSYQRLNPGSGMLAQTKATDIFGNSTVSTTTVDRANKKVVVTTDTPDSTIDAVQVAYNGLGVEARDTVGVTMRTEYDDLGRINKSIDPRTGATTTAYKAGTSLVDWVKDPAGVAQATYTYDAAGRVATATDAFGKISRYEYTLRGEKLHEWGANTYPVEYGYDNWGRQVSMKTYASSTETFTGDVWPTSSPNNPQTTTWTFQESTGLLDYKQDNDGKKVNFTYDAARRIKTREWARILPSTTRVTTTYSYFGEQGGEAKTGEVRLVHYNDGTPDVSYTYNRLGQPATVNDGVTGPRTFTYNLAGTLEAQEEILGTTAGAFYGDRRLTRKYDTATGVVGRYNALWAGSAAAPASEYNLGYGYDTSGRLNQVMGAFTYAYTPNSHLIQSTTWGGYSDTRTYDPTHDWLDERATLYSSVNKVTFGFLQDTMGRITDTTRTGEIFSRYGNGTEGLKTTYGYDDRSQLTSEVTKIGATTTVLTGRNDAYNFDLLGNRKTTTHNGNTSTYALNANGLNQYDTRTVPAFFDLAGATLANATVTVNGSATGVVRHGEYFFKAQPFSGYGSLTVADGLITPLTGGAFVPGSPEAMTYDADGNLTRDGRWVYIYDGENRLVAMFTRGAPDDPNASDSANVAIWTSGLLRQKLQFSYDCLGRRVQKNVSTWSGSLWSVVSSRRFLYDGWNVLFELDAFAALAKTRSYVWGLDLSGTLQGAGGVGGLLVEHDYATSQDLLPVYDGNGNIHGLVKQTDGTLVASYEYDAFGRTLRESGPLAASNPFRFATKYADLETGLVQYNTRYYSPSLGRFLNRDTISQQGGLNLYAYCGNNGVNRWDYLGMVESRSTSDGGGDRGNGGGFWAWVSGLFGGGSSGGSSSSGVGDIKQNESTKGVHLAPLVFLGVEEAPAPTSKTQSLPFNFGASDSIRYADGYLYPSAHDATYGIRRDQYGNQLGEQGQVLETGEMHDATIDFASLVVTPPIVKTAVTAATSLLDQVAKDASAALAAALGRAAENAGAQTTRLFRAVEGEELKDVLRYGDYNIHPNSTFKRFAFDEGSLDTFIQANPGRNYTKTFIDLPTEKLDFMIPHGDPGGVGKAIGIDVFENPQFYDWFKGVKILGPK